VRQPIVVEPEVAEEDIGVTLPLTGERPAGGLLLLS